jgi:hypothetical protein
MRISNQKKEKILEQVLAFLYASTPKPVFTLDVAKETARDEEFIKRLLLELKERNMVVEVKKNPKGIPYSRRSRWKLSDATYKAYKEHQSP